MSRFGLEHEGESGVLEDTRQDTAEPPLYRVILHNDHYTTQEFVVAVIMKVFQTEEQEAVRLMYEVHTKGKASVGVFTWDIAQSKSDLVHSLAAREGFPLRCSITEA